MLKLRPGGWYRDDQDVLWLDAECIDADPRIGKQVFRLYRGGGGPRDYTIEGVLLADHFSKPASTGPFPTSFNLVREIDRDWPVTAPVAEPPPEYTEYEIVDQDDKTWLFGKEKT